MSKTVREGAIALAGAGGAAVALFLMAGDIYWWRAWPCAVSIGISAFLSRKAFADHPELAEERKTAAKKATAFDRVLTVLMGVALPVMLVVSALDKRLAWTAALGDVWLIPALLITLGGVWITYRALVANAFFSSHVRLQADRGQVVVTHGPYGVVRHPGYAGALLFNVGLPAVLGSRVGVCAALVMIPLLVVRILTEERVLNAGLSGYRDYTRQVRWRLAPYLW